jgi:predicted DsbA family dithiol-disulfide isomerase
MTRTLSARSAPDDALPAWIKPQLCQLVKEAPSGDEWAHELKFDGYRMHAGLDHGDIRLLTRTGLDWTGKYQGIATALRTLPARQAYLDGELCGVRPDGLTSFALIQNAAERQGGTDLVYFVFDLLHLDWFAVGLNILRAGAHHSVMRREFAGDQARRGEVADADRQVNPILHKVYDAVAHQQLEGMDRRTYRSRKFGSWERSEAMDTQTVLAGRGDGTTFDYEAIKRTPNTFLAHRVSWLAQREGKQRAFVQAALKGYFAQGRDIGSKDVLAEIAGEIGLDQDAVAAFLSSDEGVESVRALERAARKRAVQGVPHFDIGGTVVTGVQRADIIRRAIIEAAGRLAPSPAAWSVLKKEPTP